MALKKHKKKIAIIISVIIVLLLVIDIGASNYLLNFATKNSSKAGGSISSSLATAESDEQQALEKKANDTKEQIDGAAVKWAETAKKEDVNITSKDGLNLYGTIYKQEKESHLWNIDIHGFNSTSKNVLNYAKEFYDHGYNVLTPDLRAYGKSEGTYTSMGWKEKDDLLLWINQITEKDPQAKIALHGVSMGAATIMMASGEKFPENVKVAVEDAGYSSVWEEYTDKLKSLFNLPTFPLLNTASLLCYIRMGYTFAQASSVDQLKKNETPMLFIHGDKDDYNPFWMLDKVYDADKSTEKEKLVVKGARHTMSAYTDPQLYWGTVWTFVNKYMN